MSIWVCSSGFFCSSKQLSLECLISAFLLPVPSLSLLPPQSNTGSCYVLRVFCLSLDLCSYARNFPLVFQSCFAGLSKAQVFSLLKILRFFPRLLWVMYVLLLLSGVVCASFVEVSTQPFKFIIIVTWTICVCTSLSVLSVCALLWGAACHGHFISLTSQEGLLRCWAANLWGVWEWELQLENNFCLLYRLFSSCTSLSVGLHRSAILHLS